MAEILKPLTPLANVLGSRSTNKKEGPACLPKPKDRKYRKGVRVWIHHPTKVWSKATIIQISDNGQIVVQQNNGQEKTINMKNNYPLFCGVSSEWKQLDDLTKLNPLHEAAVLECLQRRCKANQYCTKAGITLVAINPFKEISGLYGTETVNQYRHSNTKDQSPHVFAVAEHAFSSMGRGVGYLNQSIVVSGESGAGKTWTARCLMKYLASVAVPFNPGGFQPSPAECLEKRILDSNPLLEAFGNAATVRNHNSSRFGKYIKLQFDRGNHIVGAAIQTFLLEKTRVVHQAENEHNFHIFYQLLRGATFEEKERWGLRNLWLGDHQAWTYLSSLHTKSLKDDTPDLASTRKAMHNVGLSSTIQKEIFQVLIGILHLGNLSFISDEDMDPCEINDSDSDCEHSLQFASHLLGLDPELLVKGVIFRQITASHSSRRKSVFMRPCTVKEAITRRDCLSKLIYSSHLLGLDPELLVKGVIFRQITASHSSRRKSVFMRPCTVKEAITRRDCLSKLIYSSLFDWLVSSINKTTCAGEWYSFIGILDIYGFESFCNNSLEQLCINYANEKLQQHFVTHFLRAEQEEYKLEAIPWTFCSFTDNRLCLETIEGKISIFTLMNEECNLNRQSNPRYFSQRVLDTLKTPYISQPHRSLENPAFVIKHYAEAVTYNVPGLIEKNKDHIPLDLVALLSNSQNIFVTRLVPKDASNEQLSVDSLMSILYCTAPHYIRCIKPNTSCQPDVFDSHHIVSQLRSCGVLETITISAAGFPTKMKYVEFWQRYSMLLRNVNANQNDALMQRCADIITAVFGDEGKENSKMQALYGSTKIFLPDGQLEQLECVRAEAVIDCVKCIQRAWRHYIQKKQKMIQWAATTIQAGFRGWKGRCYVATMHDAARVIQHAMLLYSIRRQLKEDVLQTTNACEAEITTDVSDEKDSTVNVLPNMNNVNAPKCSCHEYSSTISASNQSTLITLQVPGYSCRALHSGIDLLQASLSAATRQSQLSTMHSSQLFEEIDGIIEEDESDMNGNQNVSSNSALMDVLKMPIVDVALAVTSIALLVKGPFQW